MKSGMSMSFRQSILYLLGVSLLVTVIIGGIGSYYTLRNSANISAQYDNTIKPIVYIQKVKTNYWKVYALLLQIALDKDPALMRANYGRVQELRSRNEGLLEQYARDGIRPGDQKLFDDFTDKRRRYLEVLDQALELDLTTTNDRAINAFNRFNNEKLLPVFNTCLDALDELNLHILDAAAVNIARAAASSHRVFVLMVGIIIAAMAVLLLLGRYFSNSIMRLVHRLTDMATAIAAGDFSRRLEGQLMERKDEFGSMARSLELMRENLEGSITELNRTAESLAASNRRLQQASEYKSTFLARMSHEIRTPLNAIVGMVYIARKASDPAVVRGSLDKINTSSVHLLGVINDVLDISKIEAGKFELVDEEFGLEKLLMNVCTVVSVKTDEKEQDLGVSFENALPSRFVGDSLRLAQVLTNLLNNASKFTPAKGRIKLSVSCLERDSLTSVLRFTVTDTGIGLTPEQIGRLFTPFEQAESGTARQFGGTGLGLAICDKIARLMEGGIQVRSEFGKGSSFSLTVKLKNSRSAGRSALDESVDRRACRMLVIDEAPETRDFFSRLFGELGIEAETAGSPAEAMRLLRESTPGKAFSIVFIDWNTAEEEGEAFVRRVKEEFGGRIVVILLSMFKFGEVEERARRAGVNRFLAKPVFPSSVVNLINELLGLPRPESADPEREDAKFGGKRVLLAEDVDINREIVFAYLENTDLVIDVAENGIEAVERYLAAEGNYDLVLMDVHMPLMDGYTATGRIREEERAHGWKRAPIAAMTANVFKADIERCLESGMDDHLAKPMSAESLMKIVRKYLAG